MKKIDDIVGLSSTEVKELQEEYGKNILVVEKHENIIIKIVHIITEPMFLLLIIAAVVYFILGEPRDGIIMLVFVIGIIGIDAIQEWKTDKTLKSLKNLSAPKVTVIRDGKNQQIESEELVPGDVMLVYEGVKIPADGKIIQCTGLRVDESSLTGESEAVWKTISDESSEYFKKKYLLCRHSYYFWDSDCFSGKNGYSYRIW